jgi:hypothetical protein
MNNKIFYVHGETQLYDVNKGIITANEVSYGKTYDLWGNLYDFSIIKDAPQKIKIINHMVIFGDKTQLPEVGHVPAKKWFLHDRCDEAGRKNLLAECLENDKNGTPVLHTTDASQFLHILSFLPFYGVTVREEASTGKIFVDEGRPSCFFNRSIPNQDWRLEEHLRFWSDGGWFRTLNPINDSLVDAILENGIMYEGYKGFPDMLPILSASDKIEREITMYKIIVPEEAGIDFGTVYL